MIKRSFGTHDGTFHADEVSACALLLVFGLIDRDKIHRTRDPKELALCEYVCDVGGVYDPKKKRFDHHQLEYSGDLSSAGMIWLYLLDQKIIDRPFYDFVNHSIILGIDAHDIGKVMQKEGVCTFSHVIANFVPVGYGSDEHEINKAFFEALDFVVGHFQRLFKRYHYILSCRDKVAAAMAPQNEALIFDEAMPWLENFFELGGEHHPALFVIMPAQDHWKLRGIPPNPHEKMDVRIPLPESWAGLRDEALRQASGIQGAIFCHKGRFISVWATKEDALKALNAIVKKG